MVVDDFYKLPRGIRNKVSSGLRGVRIHIVDTFAYEAETKQIMRGIFKCDDYAKMLREMENQELAKHLILGMEETVARQILLDSPAQRLERALRARSMYGFGYTMFSQQEHRRDLSMDLDPFKKGKKKVYDTAAKWASKSASVMSDAVEYASIQFPGEYEARQQVARMLDVAHAFDEGDDASIEWIKGQRNHFVLDTVYGMNGFLKPLYGDVDSRLSIRTQAADIAARIGQRIYDEYALDGVLERFDFVTFNGERINQSNISACIDFWRAITEREEKIEKLVDGLK